MYNFIKAICLPKTIGAQWKTLDISNLSVSSIYESFSKVFLVLTNNFIEGELYIDFNTLREEFSTYSKSLNDLLTDLSTRPLETVPSLPSTNVKYINYSDAFYSGYKVDTTIIGVGSPENYRPEDRKDLKITRPNYTTDLKLLHSHCLISVNGYFHMTDADEKAAYVKEGRLSRDRSNNNHVGITSFLDIGELTKIPITEDMIFSQAVDSRLYEKTYINLNQDINNKVVLMVVGGYLYLPQENVFWRVGERSFAINWSAIPLIDRYYESNKYLDLSSLELPKNTFNDDMINVNDLLSDEVLKRYLTLSQSFFVIVDTDNLFSEKLFIRNNGMPGMFTSYKDPTLPLIVGYGKLAEYWKTFEDQVYSVTVEDSFMRNFVFDEKPMKQLNIINSNALPYNTFKHSQGFLLMLGSFK